MLHVIKTIIFLVSISLSSTVFAGQQTPIIIKILGINDFHGQISAGRFSESEPVGGAAVLAAYLKQAQAGMEERTLITMMGDQVGASPPASGLLHDEPTILFTNSLGNSHCTPEARMNPLCNLVATVGNHEFDKGQQAMLDLIYGTNQPPTDHWIPIATYPGASYPYISANIVDAHTGRTIFPPYIIKSVDNIPVAFIGAVLKSAADSMFPANAAGVSFLDEADTINHYLPEIRAQGARIIVVLIHEGGTQRPYVGPTQKDTVVDGAIKKIIYRLDNDVDVVMGGHTHQFLNAFIPNRHGKDILVTQANSYSTSFAEVTLEIDPQQQKIIHKSAQIITAYANRWPGTMGDQPSQMLVAQAENKVAPLVNEIMGSLSHALVRDTNSHGESNLGNFIADAFRIGMNADIGMTNLHGMRNDLKAGAVTWGDVYAVIPFANTNVVVSLTGQDIYDLLEQQWTSSATNMLQISGISYTYSLQKAVGNRIISIMHQGQPLLKDKIYTIATTDFIASGHGIFSVMQRSKLITVGAYDHDTVNQYIKSLTQPFNSLIDGRIMRV